MKTKQTSEVLHETSLTIKGNEPFLSFQQAGLIVNFTDRFGRSHIFAQNPFGYSGIPLHRLGKGEVLQFQVVRVREVPVEPWYKTVLADLRKWWAR